MKKTVAIICLSVLLHGCILKTTTVEENCIISAESPDPNADTAVWKSKGLTVSYGSINKRYAKYREPDIAIAKTHKLYAWKGERVSAQILVWTSTPLWQLKCEVHDLKSGGAVIPAGAIRARFVRYTLTDEFGNACGSHAKYPPSLVGDMLDDIDCINMDAKSVRPIWITVDVPNSVSRGTYSGNIKVSAIGKKNESKKLKLELEVSDKTLPPASEWKYHLDLWQHPSAVARIQNLKLWSDEHFDAMRPLMKMLADAGQKVITATLNKDPWNHQCFDAYEDMIVWTRNEDGSWSYDYTIFDKWISFMMNTGINKMINCYSMAPWNNELHYRDAKSGDMITVNAHPGTAAFAEIWTPFLKDFVRHLTQNKWIEITNIAMDERPPAVMDEILVLLKKEAPELGIALADSHQSYKKYSYIRDLCVVINSIPDADDLEYRKKNGLNTTYYVCCAHKFPNMFTFSDPAEAVYAGWFAKANGFDGFLRWAYNSWVENPAIDSRFRTWPAGDTFIVYPEAKSSIRFERLIEGIQDYEKIAMCQNGEIKAILENFKTSKKPDNMETLIEEAKKIFRQ
ncbi:MAG: DUF4091 domain-containing protein [Prevotellaceae bacterium]|jgi:hypothetical protein|nr:DUF4091 domain-containing protein [Prevotellaceae bacterium]